MHPACRGVFDQHTESLQAALLLTMTFNLCGARGTHSVSPGTSEVLHNLTFALKFLIINKLALEVVQRLHTAYLDF